MAITVAQLIARLSVDSSRFRRGLQDSEGALAKFGSAVKMGAAAGAAAFATFGVAAFKAASDLEETLNATGVAFGEAGLKVNEWADGLDAAFGLTKQQALDAATGFQLVARESGLSATQITDLTERAADLGSVFNVAGEDVATAIKSGLVGETEPMRRFGVMLSEASLQAEAVRLGLVGVGDEMNSSTKQVAAYNLIMGKTAFAQGDATETADSAAGQIRVLKTSLGDLTTQIGQKLLPVGIAFLKWLNESSDGILQFTEDVVNGVGDGVGFVADAIGFVLGYLRDFMKAASNVTNIFGADGVTKNLRDTADAFDEYSEKLHKMSEFEADFSDIGYDAAGAIETITAAAQNAAGSMGEYSEVVEDSTEAMKEAADAAGELRDAEFSLRDAQFQVIAGTEELIEAQEDYNALVNSGGVDIEKVIDAQNELIDVQDRHAAALDTVREAQEALNEASQPASKRDLKKATRDLQAATDNLTSSELDAADAQAKLDDLRTTGVYTAEEWTRAQLAANRAGRQVSDAEDGIIAAEEALVELRNIGTPASDEFAAATDRLREAQDREQQVKTEQLVAQQAMNQSWAVAEDFADRVKDATRRVRDAEYENEKAAWAAEKATWAYADALAAVQWNADGAVGSVNNVRNALNQLPNTKTIGIQMMLSDVPAGAAESGFHFPTMHSGGIVPGAKGADVPIMAQAGETVIPAGQSGGTVINITVAGDTDPDGAARRIHELLLARQRQGTPLRFR